MAAAIFVILEAETLAWSVLLRNYVETEAFITPAQDHTKTYNAKVLNCTDDPSCTLCYSSGETIYHLVSASPALAATEYLKRYNSVASIIHKNVCEFYEISTCEKPWLYNLQPVVLSGGVKILWDHRLCYLCS